MSIICLDDSFPMNYIQVEENVYEVVVFLPLISKQLNTGITLNTVYKHSLPCL